MLICGLLIILLTSSVNAQTAMINIQSRELASLNGKWKALIDPTDAGGYRQVWQEKKPQKKTDFFEYSFEGAPELKVPGDFNSQMRELTYFEGTVWYRKRFSHTIREGKRIFLHFSAVNYLAEVYLNGEKIGSHEGGFTPFQFEITNKMMDGDNTLIVMVNNDRREDGLPGLGSDWLNYGGITRDVDIVEVPETYIDDYFIQLGKGSLNAVEGWVHLDGAQAVQDIEIEIPELKLSSKAKTDENGFAKIEFSADFELWSPENPKLYAVTISSETDSITDSIGFRSIEVQGTNILLNKKPIFLKAINIHEENPYKRARAYSWGDDKLLLDSAKELGCNLVRLAHYPHNETMVREAEKMGLMVWSEIPVFQHIKFSNSSVPQKMETMLEEMIRRDRNRCGVAIWSLSNETYPGTPGRDSALAELTEKCRELDATRLIVHVANTHGYSDNTVNVWDTIYQNSDIIAVNEYIGWYKPWQGEPSDVKWKLVCPDKPVFISEFGGEAKYGSNEGPTDEANYWTEEYQRRIYIDQIEMFKTIPNLRGVCPWILFDYRSLFRMNTIHQDRYNRKGLLSEDGERKKAWYIMKKYYEEREQWFNE